MILVSSWVKAIDGHWYKDPIIDGVTEFGHRWFVCFDDDDEPEFVYELGDKTSPRVSVKKVLADAGIKVNSIYKARTSGRLFIDTLHFVRADGYFLNIVDLIPVPTRYDDVETSQSHTINGVFYDFGSRKESL